MDSSVLPDGSSIAYDTADILPHALLKRLTTTWEVPWRDLEATLPHLRHLRRRTLLLKRSRSFGFEAATRQQQQP